MIPPPPARLRGRVSGGLATSRRPARSPRRLDPKVRNGRGNAGKFGTKDGGEAHQMNVVIERRERPIPIEHFIDTGERFRQCAESIAQLQQQMNEELSRIEKDYD